ncbi:cyclic pyranopterin monophosphate synthase MoaC [Brevibacillus marinus]|uniref:cyclic pyranopterin monophosphate synthase MoaC n=1 Tax=Brevibacillus marinus TaxID=2496837 RepID=UPI000F829AC1|nr:cyclic pyranopterin monophosphate synthase MoaC [Brevibacillus marinus]
MEQDPLTHFNEQRRAKMVDISDKETTRRTAVACSQVKMKPETLQRVREGRMEKGDVLAVAQVAGIMAAKKTWEIIPMCHPLPLSGIDIRFAFAADDTLTIEAEVKTTGRTGVEMEALTAASVAALTVYDMCKAMDKAMILGPTYLKVKTGGKSGDFLRTDFPGSADAQEEADQKF